LQFGDFLEHPLGAHRGDSAVNIHVEKPGDWLD
jgi:hypothetical protein